MPAREVTATFINIPSPAFTVDGGRMWSDTARVDLGAILALSDTRSLFANLSGEFSGHGESHAATAGARMAW